MVYDSGWLRTAATQYTTSRSRIYNPMWLDDFVSRQGTINGLWTPAHPGSLNLKWYWWGNFGGTCDVSKGLAITAANDTDEFDGLGVQVQNTSSEAISVRLVVINMCDGSATWSDGTSTYTDWTLLQPNSGVTTICKQMINASRKTVASHQFLLRLEAMGADGVIVITDELTGNITKCNGTSCTQPSAESFTATTAGCCSGLGKCSDGICRRCQPSGSSPTCSGLDCCNSNPKCSDGTCKDCAGSGQQVSNCAGCCPGFEKCSDNKCRSVKGTDCTPSGVFCNNSPCCFSLTHCGKNGNLCQACVDNGQQFDSTTCCCSGTKECTDGFCRNCIPVGSKTTIDPSGTLSCCSGAACSDDNICRTCIDDNHDMSLCPSTLKCCNYTCPQGCRSKYDPNIPNSGAGDGESYWCKDQNGAQVDIGCRKGTLRCSDGKCHTCPPLPTFRNPQMCCTGTPYTSCDSSSKNFAKYCSIPGYGDYPLAPCPKDGCCHSCTPGGSNCDPPHVCCPGFQRCLPLPGDTVGYCRSCNQGEHAWDTCNPSDACCCQWEAVDHSFSCDGNHCSGDDQGKTGVV